MTRGAGGLVTLALALLGPIGFVRKFVRKFAVWAVLASLLYLTWWALGGAGFGALWFSPFGPLQAFVGFPLNKLEVEDSTTFEFSVGGTAY